MISIDQNESSINTPDKPSIKKIVIFGLLIIGIFVGGFSLWAAISPLESAAMAPGKIIVAGYRRMIQHLEGGIIQAIYVKDGLVVKKGQVLLQLDDNQAKIVLQLRRDEVFELMALVARLQAEKANLAKIIFPKRMMDQEKDKKVQEVIDGQIAIFDANEKSFRGSIDLLGQRIVQLKEEIKGTESSIAYTKRQLELIDEEEKSVAYLEKQKLIERSRLLSLQREAAKLKGMIGEYQAKISVLMQQIGEAKLKIVTLEKDRQKEILTDLREAQQKLSAAIEKEKAAEDVLQRTTIRSPLSGEVVDLKVHTIGGVVRPGEPIMDIVPNREKLVVEAKVSPIDIDIVHKGLVAKVQLTAFKARITPYLTGRVTRVSADIVTDQASKESYYLARIEIDKGEIDKLPKSQKLYPGMPAQVMIITEKLTPWQYFVKPITESFDKAFREQ